MRRVFKKEHSIVSLDKRILVGFYVFLGVAGWKAHAEIPQVQCTDTSHGVQCVITFTKPISSSIQVVPQEKALSLTILQENPRTPPLAFFRPVQICSVLLGYEVHRTSEKILLRFTTTRLLHVNDLSLMSHEGKFLLRFMLVPAATPSPLAPSSTKELAPPYQSKKREASPRLIALDPGHGGIDPGARGINGIQEKDITLKMARILEEVLQKRGYRVVLTRTEDTALTCVDRLKKIEAAKADFFISLHADHNPAATMHGVSIYTLASEASDLASARLAQKENAADLNIDGVKVSSPAVAQILQDLAKHAIHQQADQFARLFETTLDEQNYLPHMHRSANFLILHSTTVPSVLIELGYLSNKNDCNLLTSNIFLYRIAHRIAKTMEQYFMEVPQ
jgi:N-acetylmuramoyl-L-alanine amidase